MKGTICIAAIAALIGTPALAADIAVKAPPAAPAPVYNWTGFYVGGNIGASFARLKTDFNAAPVTVNTTGGSFIVPGFAQPDDELFPGGFIGGGQIGYNWQFSPIWVLGVEADIQGGDEKASATFSNPFSFSHFFPCCGTLPVTGAAVTNYSAQIDWFGTVRLRAGYVWGDGAVMSYVTGGLAYGEVKTGGTSIVSGSVGIPSNTFAIAHAIGHSHVNTGWTVGTGTEGKLLIPGWTYKIEALYMDLGTLNDTDDEIVIPLVLTASGGQVTTHTRFTDTIIRAGLNYQFH
jgi:outer membrane immunogenic protein